MTHLKAPGGPVDYTNPTQHEGYHLYETLYVSYKLNYKHRTHDSHSSLRCVYVWFQTMTELSLTKVVASTTVPLTSSVHASLAHMWLALNRSAPVIYIHKYSNINAEYS